jgi:hypothetical protein
MLPIVKFFVKINEKTGNVKQSLFFGSSSVGLATGTIAYQYSRARVTKRGVRSLE